MKLIIICINKISIDLHLNRLNEWHEFLFSSQWVHVWNVKFKFKPYIILIKTTMWTKAKWIEILRFPAEGLSKILSRRLSSWRQTRSEVRWRKMLLVLQLFCGYKIIKSCFKQISVLKCRVIKEILSLLLLFLTSPISRFCSWWYIVVAKGNQSKSCLFFTSQAHFSVVLQNQTVLISE